MKSYVVEVHEILAKEWLEKNTFNRKLSRHTVNKYASDMKAGNWTLNHQGIAFDDAGVLVDGQHRLMAVIESGVTVPMMVTWGASRVGIDELRARSTADVIKFGGLSEWLDNRAVQTAKQMILHYSGLRDKQVTTTSEVVEFSEKNKDAIIFTKENFTSNSKGVSSALVRAAFATAYHHYDKEILSEMIASLYSGVVIGQEKSAAAKAKDMLLSQQMQGGRSARDDVARKLTRAIDCYARGIPLKALRSQSSLIFTVPESKQ